MFLILLCPLMALKLVETFPQNKEHLHTYCVVGLYILTLLVDGYKFDEHTWSNIHFSQKVKKKSPVGQWEQAGSCGHILALAQGHNALQWGWT